MINNKLKFAIGVAIILAVAGYEAATGFKESETYYVTVQELVNGKAQRHRIRVGGVVEVGSIERHKGKVSFRLAQEKFSIPVTYVGADTLPDTFKDGAQAIVQGDYTADGTFRASEIQAKCASKYQAVPGQNTKTPVASLNSMN
jgi:cytochrome c-type biogenesis protein CcmE